MRIKRRQVILNLTKNMFKPKDYDDFEKLISDFNWQLLTSNPHSDDVQDWIAKVNGILWDFDSPSSNEFQKKISWLVNMWSGIKAGTVNSDLSYDVGLIKQFLRNKAEGMRREKEKMLSGDKSTTPEPKLRFGEPGQAGHPGSGGSIFIQAENFTLAGGGKISADGGDYIVHQNELNNFGTINQTLADTINNITKLTNTVNQSDLEEIEKRQLIGDIETIKAQIIKPKPDKTILQKAWDAVQIASTIGGAAQLLGLIGQVVLPLLK